MYATEFKIATTNRHIGHGTAQGSVNDRQTVVAEQQQQRMPTEGALNRSVSVKASWAPDFRALGFRSEVWVGRPMISRFKTLLVTCTCGMSYANRRQCENNIESKTERYLRQSLVLVR